MYFNPNPIDERESVEQTPKIMDTLQEKMQCGLWFVETKLDTQTQQNYRTKYGKYTPSHPGADWSFKVAKALFTEQPFSLK